MPPGRFQLSQPNRRPSLLEAVDPEAYERKSQETLQSLASAPLRQPNVDLPVQNVDSQVVPLPNDLVGAAPQNTPELPPELTQNPELNKPDKWKMLGRVLMRDVLPNVANFSQGVAAGSQDPDPFGAFARGYSEVQRIPFERERMQAENEAAWWEARKKQADVEGTYEDIETKRAERETLLPSEVEQNQASAWADRANAILREEQARQERVLTGPMARQREALGESQAAQAVLQKSKARLIDEQIKAGTPRAEAEKVANEALRAAAQAEAIPVNAETNRLNAERGGQRDALTNRRLDLEERRVEVLEQEAMMGEPIDPRQLQYAWKTALGALEAEAATLPAFGRSPEQDAQAQQIMQRMQEINSRYQRLMDAATSGAGGSRPSRSGLGVGAPTPGEIGGGGDSLGIR